MHTLPNGTKIIEPEEVKILKEYIKGLVSIKCSTLKSIHPNGPKKGIISNLFGKIFLFKTYENRYDELMDHVKEVYEGLILSEFLMELAIIYKAFSLDKKNYKAIRAMYTGEVNLSNYDEIINGHGKVYDRKISLLVQWTDFYVNSNKLLGGRLL